jgi:acyl carrier protein
VSTRELGIEQRLREVVLACTPIDPDELTDDMDLSDEIDSFAAAELVLAAGDLIGRPVRPHELRGDDIKSIRAMATWIRRLAAPVDVQ